MYLTYEKEDLIQQSSYETAREIMQQPTTWKQTLDCVEANQERLETFFSDIRNHGEFSIVMMGAGTSEYIGNVLEPWLNRRKNYQVRSVASTDMVVAPKRFINPSKTTLFISYGRSGNSPESVGAIEAAQSICQNAFHLMITCNPDGALHRWSLNRPNALSILLPKETNDLGFAMTSSFTSMLLASLLILEGLVEAKRKDAVSALSFAVDQQLQDNAARLREIVDTFDFSRIIYLGSNVLKGFAQESALKVLELTSGRIATLFDSFLGFRHGPKSFLNEQTLVVLFIQDSSFTRRYELDLLQELIEQQKGYKILVVSHRPLRTKSDYHIQLPYNAHLSSAYYGLEMVTVAQTLAFLKSVSLNITTDNPCPSGSVNRVVKGVTIYPVITEEIQ